MPRAGKTRRRKWRRAISSKCARAFYNGLIDAPVVVNEENFRVWGASTVPTLALVDRGGIVRMYHPGALPYAELRARIAALL